MIRIGLGAMPLSLQDKPDENEAIKLIHYFLENGGYFIDTADVYGLDDADRGHNERLIAKAIKAYGNKNHIFIATKGGATRPSGGWALGAGHPKQLRLACEQSLKNLNIDSHQLYYLHGPDPKIPLSDSLDELIHLKNQGKIQHIGIANVNLSEIKLANQMASIFAIQNRCNPFCKADLTNGVVDFCKENNILYVPYCPLGGFKETKLANDLTFKTIAKKYHLSPYALSLAWLLHQSSIMLPIPGMDKIEFIDINFKALDVELSLEDKQTIHSFPDYYVPKHVDI